MNNGAAHVPQAPPGPGMTLGNMRGLGVQRLVAYCLNDSCRQQASWTPMLGALFALSKHRGAANGWNRTNARECLVQPRTAGQWRATARVPRLCSINRYVVDTRRSAQSRSDLR